MFTTPIRHTPLSGDMEELKRFSYLTKGKATPMTKCHNNGQVAFADEYGQVYVTPCRTETHSVLEKNGYEDDYFFVPFSNGEKRPDAYLWLVKIADQENWAVTHETAYQIAQKKGIKPVEVPEKYQIKEISNYTDTSTHMIYTALTVMYLTNESKDNIGSYILVDEKTVVICDEYGRTFLVKAKTVINDLVNALIEAGYKHTAHPEWYIRTYEPDEEEAKEKLKV